MLPDGKINVTDPDSRLVQDKGLAKIQGYNAQAAVCTDGQIIIAAEISVRSPDFGHLGTVFDAGLRDLRSARSIAPADRRARGRRHSLTPRA